MFKFCSNAIASVTKYGSSIPSVTCVRYSSIFANSSLRVLAQNPLLNNINNTSVRTVKNILNDGAEPYRVLNHDRKTGRRTSCEIVPKQFYRLHWGIWIRTRCGRDKQVHRKSSERMRRYRQHVFCNAKQSRLLDAMTSPWFRKRHYYIDDPYEPYHTRDEFLLTRKKPVPGINGEIVNYV